MIGVYQEQKRQYIYGFCIEPGYQKMGIGKAALFSVLRLCKRDYPEKMIVLEVQADNKSALSLYLKSGFKVKTEFQYFRALL
jgi:ribosomal protein S18 acetylase RimI-like enzyme